MSTGVDPKHESARVVLEPWFVGSLKPRSAGADLSLGPQDPGTTGTTLETDTARCWTRSELGVLAWCLEVWPGVWAVVVSLQVGYLHAIVSVVAVAY